MSVYTFMLTENSIEICTGRCRYHEMILIITVDFLNFFHFKLQQNLNSPTYEAIHVICHLPIDQMWPMFWLFYIHEHSKLYEGVCLWLSDFEKSIFILLDRNDLVRSNNDPVLQNLLGTPGMTHFIQWHYMIISVHYIRLVRMTE